MADAYIDKEGYVRSEIQSFTTDTNFQRLRQTKYYVDKSLFIKDFLQYAGRILITRPGKWGKSLNLEMLKMFLSPKHDYLTQEHKRTLFFGGQMNGKQLQPLLIVQKKQIIDEYFFKYSTIYLSFLKQKFDDNEVFVDILGDAFREHEYLISHFELVLQGKAVSSFSKQRCKQTIGIINKFIYEKQALKGDRILQLKSIKLLSQYLFQYCGKKVIILIDDYDHWLNSKKRFRREKQSQSDEQFHRLMQAFYNYTLKDNYYLQKALIFGRYLFEQELMNSNFMLNGCDLQTFSFTQEKFANSFGFTNEQVENLLEIVNKQRGAHNQKTPEITSQDVKCWYNGYKIGKLFLYNPAEIMKFIARYRDKVHKKDILLTKINDTGLNNVLRKLIEKIGVKQVLEKIILNKKIEKSQVQSSSVESQYLIELLLHEGHIIQNRDYFEIPNIDAQNKLFKQFASITASQLENGLSSDAFFEQLLQHVDDGKQFVKLIELWINQRPVRTLESPNEVKQPGQLFRQINFHILISGAFQNAERVAQARHTIDNQVRSRDGNRADTVFLPIKDRSSTAIVLQYKHTRDFSESTADDLLEEGFRQIILKNYLDIILDKSQNLIINKVLARALVAYAGGRVKMLEKQYKMEQVKTIVDYVKHKKGDDMTVFIKNLIKFDSENFEKVFQPVSSLSKLQQKTLRLRDEERMCQRMKIKEQKRQQALEFLMKKQIHNVEQQLAAYALVGKRELFIYHVFQTDQLLQYLQNWINDPPKQMSLLFLVNVNLKRTHVIVLDAEVAANGNAKVVISETQMVASSKEGGTIAMIRDELRARKFEVTVQQLGNLDDCAGICLKNCAQLLEGKTRIHKGHAQEREIDS